LMGSEWLIPADVIATLAAEARLRPIVHPADAPAEPGYVPSRALADFVRCRDLTCRAPGCDKPAIACDLDHTIPYGIGGPTHASNLKCLCRHHHLWKTFWGWRDEQLADGTVIWTSPAGHRTVTTPGSALIFPTLCLPTTPIAITLTDDERGDKTNKMPRRTRTRAQSRAAAITAERRANRAHHAHRAKANAFSLAQDSDPPPF
jgi:hypothetical protein